MFDTLSETQRKIVFEKSGKFVVRACPGSGKTYTVAARLAHKISSWPFRYQGIATISFTNAAWQEIQRQISEHFKIEQPISYPHFLGTIDSFINQYIFLPFGHLVMGCKRRPTLVGEPHGIWGGRYFAESLFDNISYNIDGKLYIIRKGTIRSNLTQNPRVIQTKERLIKAGYANQEDANYFGMKVLETYPSVAKALVQRFPMFLVDEAQDTSEIQMRIIDVLIENGLNEIVLVGDPDQAIFEWRAAKPKLFIQKVLEWSENSIVLNENRRSSQNICNCTCNLSSLEKTSIAVNDEVKECNIIPHVVIYDINRIRDLIAKFLDICSKNNIEINPDNVAIVFRSKSLFYAITETNEIPASRLPWSTGDLCCKDFAKGKYLIDNGDFKTGFGIIQTAFLKWMNNSPYCTKTDVERAIDKYGFVQFKKIIFSFANLLPNTNGTIGEWVKKANRIFANNNIRLTLSIRGAGKNLTFDELFSLDNKQITERDYRLGTVHSIKGETFEAVLLILKKKGIGKSYTRLLRENAKIEENEELRIVYVAITRPRRLLVLAVPDRENKDAWERKLCLPKGTNIS